MKTSSPLRALLAFFAAAAFLLRAPNLSAADNELPPDERAAGWKLLFNGHDLTGWKTNEGKDPAAPIEEESLQPHGAGGYLIYYDGAQFGDFIFKCDARMSRPICNSGVFFRIGELADPPRHGLECQIANLHANKYDAYGAIYDLVAPSKPLPNDKLNDWHTIQIECRGPSVKVAIDGEPQIDMNCDEFTQPGRRPDGSPHKFNSAIKDWPRRGWIGLQDHGNKCWFKNVKVLELDAAPAAKAAEPKPAEAKAKADAKPEREKPAPDVADARYGPHERNVFDLWKAKTDQPAPLMVFFHGGGFVGGNKTNLSPYFLEECLKRGISVASSNYRFSTQAPYPAPMLDGARAIQHIRAHAAEWGIDPTRVAACGDSAGAGISLWLAFHDDLADPKSDDPVARQSTRLACVATVGGQCSYDPRWVREHIGGRAWEHPALPKLFGVAPEGIDSPEAFKLYEEAAPINYVTKDDPPAFLYYGEAKTPLPPPLNPGPKLYYPDFGKNVPGQPSPGAGIHHPQFGYALKEKLDAVGVECVVRLREELPPGEDPNDAAHRDMAEFLAGKLRAKKN